MDELTLGTRHRVWDGGSGRVCNNALRRISFWTPHTLCLLLCLENIRSSFYLMFSVTFCGAISHSCVLVRELGKVKRHIVFRNSRGSPFIYQIDNKICIVAILC